MAKSKAQDEHKDSKRSGVSAALLLTGTALALRLLTLPLEAYQARHWLRWRESLRYARAAYQLLTQKAGGFGSITESPSNADLQAVSASLQRLASQQCSTARWKALIPWGRVIGVPAFVLTAFKVRQLALQGELQGAVPGLWLTDLAAPDPFYLLPVANALFMLRNLEYSFPLMPWSDQEKPSDAKLEVSPPQQRWLQNQSLKVVLQGAVLLITPGMLSLPSAVMLFWLTNSCIQTALSSAWWRQRWHRWIQKRALVGLHPTLACTSSNSETTARRAIGRESHLEQALHQAIQEIHWVQRVVAGVTAHRRVTPSLLKQVEFELHRWRMSGQLQLPWRAALQEPTPGRRLLSLYLENASESMSTRSGRLSNEKSRNGHG